MKGDWPNHIGRRGLVPTPFFNTYSNTVSVFRGKSVLGLAIIVALMSSALVSFAGQTQAAIVRQIPFSAALKSPSSGVSVPDNNYTIVFSLYAVETGGAPVYTETQTVGVINGVVSVNIGSITPIPTSVDFNSTYYLGIKVGDDPEMAPRRKIGSVPAAFNSSTVDGRAPGVAANNVLLLDSSGKINIQGGIATAGMLSATGIPVASGTTSLVQLGSAIVGGAAGGTYVGINTPGSFTGDFINYQVNGTSMFKIAADGTVTTNSVTTIGGNLNVQGNVLPTTTGTYDLGSASKRFANLYVDNLVAGSSSTSGTSSSSFTVNDDAPGDENSAVNFYRGGILPSAQLLWNSGTGIFNFNKGVAITGALTTTSTINTATITGGSLTGGSLSGGTYTNTGLTGSAAYTLIAQGGAINLQPSTGIVALNTANADNELRVYENAGTPTNYISLKYTAGEGVISTNTGNLKLGAGGDFTVASGVNMKVVGTAPVSTSNSLVQIGSAISGGNAAGTYLSINTGAGFTGDLANLMINGASKFKVDASGNVTAAGTISAASLTGALNITTNGAASTPAQLLSGTWFTGGSATTTKPQLLVEPSGTTSTGWNTNGTAIGANAASGFVGNLIDLQVAGVSRASLIARTNSGALMTVGQAGFTDYSGTGYNIAAPSGAGGASWRYNNLTFGDAATVASPYGLTLTSGNAQNINLQAATGIVALNRASTANELRVYENAASPANYVSILYNGSGGLVTTNTGTLQLGSSGDVTLSSGVNMKVLGTPAGSTTNSLVQLGSAISGGNAGGTYLSANSGSGFTGDFTNFLLNGTSKFKIDYNGNITAAGTVTATSFVGPATITTNGAASTPAQLLSGTWFTGGSATTTKPQLLIEPSGTTSTAWSTNGTGLGVNAATGFTGNLVDLQLAGVSKLKVDSAGLVTASAYGTHTFGGVGAGTDAQILLNRSGGDTYRITTDTTTQNVGTTYTFTSNGTGSWLFRRGSNASTVMIIRGQAAQSGFLQEWQNSSSVRFVGIGPSDTASANFGFLNIGAAPFDGATAGFFAGSASGTQLALNAASGYAGNLADWQVAGVNQFRVTAAGALSVASSLTSPILTSTGALAITSAANGNISVTPNGTGDIRLVVSGNASQDVFIGDGGTTNYAKFDTNGSLSFSGAARPYSELIFDPIDSVVPVANGCTKTQTDAANHSYFTNDCDAATDEKANWQFKMPSNYATGTNVQVDVYWEANATSGAAIFDVGYVGVADGEAWDAASITTVTGAAKTTAGTAYLVNTSTVTLTAPDITADDLVTLRLNRDADNGSDTLAVDAKVLKIRVKYLVAN